MISKMFIKVDGKLKSIEYIFQFVNIGIVYWIKNWGNRRAEFYIKFIVSLNAHYVASYNWVFFFIKKGKLIFNKNNNTLHTDDALFNHTIFFETT